MRHRSSRDGREADNQHGATCWDEPHDGREDDEREFGWTQHVGQRLAGKVEQRQGTARKASLISAGTVMGEAAALISQRMIVNATTSASSTHDGIDTIMGGRGL